MYWPVTKEIKFTYISIFSSGTKLKVLINFGKGHHEKLFL